MDTKQSEECKHVQERLSYTCFFKLLPASVNMLQNQILSDEGKSFRYGSLVFFCMHVSLFVNTILFKAINRPRTTEISLSYFSAIKKQCKVYFKVITLSICNDKN